MDDKKRILIIEDEDDIRILYSEVLREAGFEVIEASNGATGLERALENGWDLLLLDIMLPGMDGVTVLKKIKEKEELKAKPTVLLTNLGSENIIKECFSLGADGYLIKAEITPDRVVSEVTSFFDK